MVLALMSAVAGLRHHDVVGFFRELLPCLIGIEACATRQLALRQRRHSLGGRSLPQYHLDSWGDLFSLEACDSALRAVTFDYSVPPSRVLANRVSAMLTRGCPSCEREFGVNFKDISVTSL